MKNLAAIFLLSLFSASAFSEVDIADVVKKADEKRGLSSTSHSFKVSITNSGDTNKVEVYLVKLRDINSSLGEQLEPERARGRKVLMKDYDMWIFTKDIKKPIRIGLEQKLTGEVSYGDIAKTNYAGDYDAKLLSSEKINNKDVYKIELKAKNKKVTYGRIEYLVEKETNAPVAATFYALSGKPLKKADFLDFKSIKGLPRSTKMVIHDYLMKDKTSTLVFSEHKPEVFDESVFNKDRMEF